MTDYVSARDKIRKPGKTIIIILYVYVFYRRYLLPRIRRAASALWTFRYYYYCCCCRYLVYKNERLMKYCQRQCCRTTGRRNSIMVFSHRHRSVEPTPGEKEIKIIIHTYNIFKIIYNMFFIQYNIMCMCMTYHADPI